MKSGQRPVPSSVRTSHRRFSRNGGRSLVESKCSVSVPIIDAVKHQSPEPVTASTPVPGHPPGHPVDRKGENVAKKRPSKAIDSERLLHLSEQLYAHALTLQEVIRNEGEVAYDVLRPAYDRQAARQFEIFYCTADEAPTKG
jgi:hypothetical protein